MFKMYNNLNLINKTILFCSSTIDEDIDLELFQDFINNNLEFAFRSLNFIWDEYLKYSDYYDKENFLKTYYFTIKRFLKYLFKIKDKIFKENNYNLNDIDEIIEEIQDRINMIRINKYQIKYTDTKRQIINEEEYSMLFENLDIEEKE